MPKPRIDTQPYVKAMHREARAVIPADPKTALDRLMLHTYNVGEALLEEDRAPTAAEIAKYDELVAANEAPAFSPAKLDRRLEGRM